MLVIRDATAFDPTAELPMVTRLVKISTSVATITTKRRLCGATRAATDSPSASPISMLRLRLSITPVSVTPLITQAASRWRRGPQSRQASENAAATYTIVSPGGRTRRNPVSSVSVEATSDGAIQNSDVAGPTITWAACRMTTAAAQTATSRNTSLRALVSAARAGQNAA